jgi:TetR/AcrR family transcriptional regulator, transcriptional repressor for nem operon
VAIATDDAGPRLTERGRATRARIVEATAGLMFRQGVAGTSIPDVLAAAGVSASQLYHYFADKQALVRAVIEHQADFALMVQERFPADSIDGLRAWRDAVLALQEERQCMGGCVIGSMASELADTDPQARADLAAGFTRWESAIRAGLQTMRDRGELRPDADPAELALVLLTALQGGLLMTQVRRDVAPVRVALDAAIAHVESFVA